MSGFVKSASTSVPVGRSQAELEKVLRRYGATGFGVMNNYERHIVTVHFRVPDSMEDGAPQIPIRLELNILQVYDALYGLLRDDAGKYYERELQQAERVAWRQLILWVDAACSAAAAGVQKMSEAFFAHTVVVSGEDGIARRLVDHLDQVTGGTWKGLLAPGGES